MALITGIRKSWFNGRDPILHRTGVVVYTSDQLHDLDPRHILRSIQYFSPYELPENTYYRLVPLVGFVDKEKNKLMRFYLKDDQRWTIFHQVDEMVLPTLPTNEAENRICFTNQVRASVIERFGDLDKVFNPYAMALALSLNRIQYMIVNEEYPDTVFLPSWLMVDRGYIVPEPPVERVEWLQPFDIQTEIIKDHLSFHPLTVTHLCTESRT